MNRILTISGGAVVGFVIAQNENSLSAILENSQDLTIVCVGGLLLIYGLYLSLKKSN